MIPVQSEEKLCSLEILLLPFLEIEEGGRCHAKDLSELLIREIGLLADGVNTIRELALKKLVIELVRGGI